jgi:alpha-1,6-mannosyltransferase
MALLVVAGLRGLLGRPSGTAARLGGGALVAAAAAKATAGIVLPFALLGTAARRGALTGALVAGVLLGATSLLAFGNGLGGYLDVLLRQGRSVSIYSVWLYLSQAVGLETVPAVLRLLLGAIVLAVLATMLVRTVRGADWVAAAGWSLLALLVCTTWLLPWYVVLLLPLAALSTSRRLRAGTLMFCGLVLLTRLPLLLG